MMFNIIFSSGLIFSLVLDVQELIFKSCYEDAYPTLRKMEVFGLRKRLIDDTDLLVFFDTWIGNYSLKYNKLPYVILHILELIIC